MRADGSVDVAETIEADFQGESRHGLYRDIPLETQDRLGIKHSIRLVFLKAVDESGRPWQAHLSRVGVYQRIRLGREEVVYDGRKTFKISYRVQKILQAFPDHDELYWNVTGNNWAVPMLQARAVVHLPKPVPANQMRSIAYTGAYGSRAQDVLITTAGEDAVQYSVSHPLNAFEGLTVVAGWPPGLVATPSRAQRLRWFFQDNWPLAVPLAVLLLMAGIWWNFGRDPDRQTVSVQYEPPEKLTPAEAGSLVDDNVDLKDITATIVDLARRGFLTIEELKGGEYVFTRRRSVKSGGLKPHEELLLESLFEFEDIDTVSLSHLENRFYQHLPGLQTAIYQGLVKKGYWWGRPDRVRAFWWGLAAVVFTAGWFPAAASTNNPGIFIFSTVISAGIIVCFAPFMPRKTWQGARTTEKILGFEEFLRRTDEDRLKRESDPAALFERMLPYAMALGVAAQWARAFEGIYQVAPTWYIGTNGSTFTPGEFTRRLGSASDRMASTLASAPRSSGGSGFGGGFSGGGGGGGGGGAW